MIDNEFKADTDMLASEETIRYNLYMGLRKKYRLFKVFTTWIFLLCAVGTVSLGYSMIVDDEWNMASIIMCMLFMIFLDVMTFKLWLMPYKRIQAAKTGDFTWRYAPVTDKRWDMRHNDGDSTYRECIIFVDGARTDAIGMSPGTKACLNIGDTIILIRLNNANAVAYSMLPEMANIKK